MIIKWSSIKLSVSYLSNSQSNYKNTEIDTETKFFIKYQILLKLFKFILLVNKCK